MNSRPHREALFAPLSFGPIEGTHHQTTLPYQISSQPGLTLLPNVPSSAVAVSSWLPSNPTQSLAISDAPQMPPAKSCRSKRRLVPNAAWEAHKGTLRKLYIMENLTLEETMAMMEVNHGFKATKKMYKDRFKSWGMFKNLRKNDVGDVAQKLNARQNRNSEILLNGTKIPGERVRRHLAKHGKSVPETANIVVQTPSAISVNSPMATGATTKRSSRAPFLGVDVNGPFDVQSIRADGRGLSIQELLALKAKAVEQISKERFDEAILSLRTAFIGLQHRRASTHPSVVETAWCLVDAYMMYRDARDGDEIINRISYGYSKHLSLWHPQTLTHYLRVVEKLESFGRSRDARSIGFRLFAAIRDKFPSTKIIPVCQSSEHEYDHNYFISEDDLQRLFDERSDMDEIDQQLKLASIWSVARLPGMQSVVEKLISRFTSLPPDLRGREVEARCIYIRVLVYEKGHEIARSECKPARDSLANLILHDNPPPFSDLVKLSKELLHIHLLAEDTAGFRTVQKWTSNSLENHILAPFRGVDGRENASTLIGYFTDIGVGYQHRFEPKEALVWFERAYGLSVKMLGCHDATSQRLKRAVKERYYDDTEELSGL